MEVNYFTILYWFCHTSTWIHHRYIRVSLPEPPCHLPPHTIPLLLLLLLLLVLSRFSHVRLCATPQVAAHQAPPSLGFSRQEYWSGLPFPSPVHESEKWKYLSSNERYVVNTYVRFVWYKIFFHWFWRILPEIGAALSHWLYSLVIILELLLADGIYL